MSNKELIQYLIRHQKENERLFKKIKQCDRRMDKTIKEIMAVI